MESSTGGREKMETGSDGSEEVGEMRSCECDIRRVSASISAQNSRAL